MCRFMRIHHECGHITLLTHATSVRLCERAFSIGLVQDVHKAPAFCTPFGKYGRNDVYNEDLVYDIEMDHSNCHECHFAEGTPECGDQSDQSEHEQGLNQMETRLLREMSRIVKTNKRMKDDTEIPALVATIEHDWLRGMLAINSDGNFALCQRVLDLLRDVYRTVQEALGNCNTGIPEILVTYDFFDALEKYKDASQLISYFLEIFWLIEHLSERRSCQNQICKLAELCKLTFDGPQAAPVNPEHEYLLEEYVNTPFNFRDKTKAQKSFNESPSGTASKIDSPKEKVQYRAEPLAFRRDDYTSSEPRGYSYRNERKPPTIKVVPRSTEEREKYGKLSVHYFSEQPNITDSILLSELDI
ncbi:hypothetical protein GRF29_28g1533259 [Pseudopithomyces chartarum]|uniref:Uncharacterized protein n=1 Tax=Pseudopithomyces chartarum TaxID=1892770 RepID=A0AAN6M2Y1_9PLEO|nr:hypothetical protein GRF29_28g1533259 [Pseudopithomyces chartarum]